MCEGTMRSTLHENSRDRSRDRGVRLALPTPDTLPASLPELVAALHRADLVAYPWASLADPAHRAELRERLRDRPATERPAAVPPGTEPPITGPAATEPTAAEPTAAEPSAGPHRLPPVSGPAHAEQCEHDRYFEITRIHGDPADTFIAGLVLAHVAAYEDSLAMGVTLLHDAEWQRLHGGLDALTQLAGAAPGLAVPFRPQPAQWRDGYDPATRWLIGHQLFFALIQGAIIGLNCFAVDGGDDGLRLATAFLHSSAEAMKYTSDFAPDDYDTVVRPAMAPPAVRAGFSGLQTRDHAHLVRLFAALKPALNTGGQTPAYRDFVEAVVSAYAAHEFICARFRGNVLPSLRMAANSRGRTQRSGVEVIREMMRARLALIDERSGG
jgi:hypothetical protein